MTRLEPSSPDDSSDVLSVLTLTGSLLAAILGLLIWVVFRRVGAVVPLVAALLLIWPAKGMSWRRRVVRLLIVLGSLWILYKARMVVYPFLAAILVAYWLDPIVHRMEERRIPRSVGALIAVVPALAIAVTLAIFLVPILVNQTIQLVGAVPTVWQVVSQKVQAWITYVMPAGWSPDVGQLLKPLGSHVQEIARGVATSFGTVAKGIGAVIGFVGMVVLAPVMTYYLLADFDRVKGWVIARIPQSRREGLSVYVAAADRVLRSYFRGQFLVAFFVGMVFCVGLTISGLPYSILLGFVAGFLNLVPILGFWLSTLLFVIAALISGHPGPLLLRIGIVLIVEQVLESQIFTPRIVGHAVGLNPLLTILSVLVFGAVLGPVGVLLAVPASAMIKSFLDLRSARGRPAAPSSGAGPTTL
jgi:predicted PurR-regulated permease PerM